MTVLRIDEIEIPVRYGSIQEIREHTATSYRALDGTLFKNTRYIKRSWQVSTPALLASSWSWIRPYFSGFGYDANAEADYTIVTDHYTVQGSPITIATGPLASISSSYKWEGSNSYKIDAAFSPGATAISFTTGWDSTTDQCVFFWIKKLGPTVTEWCLFDQNDTGFYNDTWYSSNASDQMPLGDIAFTTTGVDFKNDTADYYIDGLRFMPFSLTSGMQNVYDGLQTLGGAVHLPFHRVEWHGDANLLTCSVTCRSVEQILNSSGAVYETYTLEIVEA